MPGQFYKSDALELRIRLKPDMKEDDSLLLTIPPHYLRLSLPNTHLDLVILFPVYRASGDGCD